MRYVEHVSVLNNVLILGYEGASRNQDRRSQWSFYQAHRKPSMRDRHPQILIPQTYYTAHGDYGEQRSPAFVIML
jgi:hypothetical protein